MRGIHVPGRVNGMAIAIYTGIRAGYIPANWASELGKLEACLSKVGVGLSVLYYDAFIVRKRKALQEQGTTPLTITVEPRESNPH
jgi:hypothetical protein